MVTPRYLTEEDHSSDLPLMMMHLVLKVERLVNRMTVDLEGLIDIFQL